jgi:hypothetical protein
MLGPALGIRRQPSALARGTAGGHSSLLTASRDPNNTDRGVRFRGNSNFPTLRYSRRLQVTDLRDRPFTLRGKPLATDHGNHYAPYERASATLGCEREIPMA